MSIASREKKSPREIAEKIARDITPILIKEASVTVAGPGFINFSLHKDAWRNKLRDILVQREKYGQGLHRVKKKIQVEFVSANPTGPLHVGHARGAAVGDSLAAILSACGHAVEREYYINDAGLQMETLGKSVYSRYLEHFGKDVAYEQHYYQGDYVRTIAEDIARAEGDRLLKIPEKEAIAYFSSHAGSIILDSIKKDLADFGVSFNGWFSEQGLYDNGDVDRAIAEYKEKKLIYEADGALWFDTTDYGDDKDRVVVKSDGEKTYFASDIAYHKNKYDRGFDTVINVWGADHHGYVVRMKAAAKAMGRHDGDLELILVQLVNLMRGGKPVSMSTRAGTYVTLREVLDEVGKDAMRYFMLMRSYDAHLDFDLELAKKKTQDNPVFYVQYAHARIASILRQAKEGGCDIVKLEDANLSLLDLPEEMAIVKKLTQFPEVVSEAGEFLEPHRITFFVFDIASLFHSYYNRNRVVSEDEHLSRARLALVVAVMIVIKNALTMLGISAPEKM